MLILIFLYQIKSCFFAKIYYLHLVANDNCHQSETDHAFNSLLYNNLVIAQVITDI